jgi:hypothetical protein
MWNLCSENWRTGKETEINIKMDSQKLKPTKYNLLRKTP